MRRGAFTLIELLVVISIITMLLALSVGGLAGAREKARETKCLANLHQILIASAAYSSEDARAQLIPVHPFADRDTTYRDGWMDYGGYGGDGQVADGMFGPTGVYADHTRPLNRTLVGDERTSVYRCPSDSGLRGGGLSGSVHIKHPALELSVADALGTSYISNGARDFYGGFPAAMPIPPTWSVGPYLRSSGNIPAPVETILVCEATFLPSICGPAMSPNEPNYAVEIKAPQGWHQRERFSTGFCDGHAVAIEAREGEVLRSREIWQGENWQIMTRGRGFRWDCVPAPPIRDLPLGEEQ